MAPQQGRVCGQIDKIVANPLRPISARFAVLPAQGLSLSQSKARPPILVPSNDPDTREG
jgi:hypothetical protein